MHRVMLLHEQKSWNHERWRAATLILDHQGSSNLDWWIIDFGMVVWYLICVVILFVSLWDHLGVILGSLWIRLRATFWIGFPTTKRSQITSTIPYDVSFKKATRSEVEPNKQKQTNTHAHNRTLLWFSPVRGSVALAAALPIRRLKVTWWSGVLNRKRNCSKLSPPYPQTTAAHATDLSGKCKIKPLECNQTPGSVFGV